MSRYHNLFICFFLSLQKSDYISEIIGTDTALSFNPAQYIVSDTVFISGNSIQGTKRLEMFKHYFILLKNSAARTAVFSISLISAVSAGVCMYFIGNDSVPVFTPQRLTENLSAFVPVIPLITSV